MDRKNFSTTIKQIWWDKKLQDFKRYGFFYEYKASTAFWDARVSDLKAPTIGTFLVGSLHHKAVVTQVCKIPYPQVPNKYIEGVGHDCTFVYRLRCHLVLCPSCEFEQKDFGRLLLYEYAHCEGCRRKLKVNISGLSAETVLKTRTFPSGDEAPREMFNDSEVQT